MNPCKSVILICAMLISCSIGRSMESEKYESGPLPSIRMKKAGWNKSQMTMRMGPSQTPCIICCRQQRMVDRMSANLEEEQAEFERACTTVDTASAALRAAKEALSVNQNEFSSAKRSLTDLLSHISELQGEIFGGDISRTRRQDIREELRTLRRETEENRARLSALRRARGPLLIDIEDAGAELQDARQEKIDEQIMVDRASRRKERAKRSLDRCVARNSS